jgi:hypothetical protein
VLIAVNASEFFTQDVEDLAYIVNDETVVTPEATSAPKAPKEHKAKQASQEPTAKQKVDNGNGHSWPAQTVTTIVAEKLAEHARHAVAMLNKSAKLMPEMPTEQVVAWAAKYREARDAGGDAEQALKLADATLE